MFGAWEQMPEPLRKTLGDHLYWSYLNGLWRLSPHAYECDDALLWVQVAALEVLADYHDPHAKSLLLSMLQRVGSSPNRCVTFPDPPAWYLQQALKRIDGGGAEVVLTPTAEDIQRVYLEPSSVSSITVFRAGIGTVHQEAAAFDPRDVILLLRTLATCPSAVREALRPPTEDAYFARRSGIRIDFTTGLRACLAVDDPPRVIYWDNARLECIQRVFDCPQAREEILAFVAGRR